MVEDCKISKSAPQLLHYVMYNLLIRHTIIVIHEYIELPFKKKDKRVGEGGNLITYCNIGFKWFDIPEVIQANPGQAVGFPAKGDKEKEKHSRVSIFTMFSKLLFHGKLWHHFKVDFNSDQWVCNKLSVKHTHNILQLSTQFMCV